MQLRVRNGYEEQCENIIAQVRQQSKRVAGNWSKVIGQTVEDWIGCGQADVTRYNAFDRPDDAPPHFVSSFPNERPTTSVQKNLSRGLYRYDEGEHGVVVPPE